MSDIFQCARDGSLDVIKRLIAQGISVDSKDTNNSTPIMYASYNGHLSLVEYLISINADLNAQNNWGNTALHLASGGGHLPVVMALLAAGADTSLKNEDGETAEALAVTCNKSECAQAIRDFRANPEATKLKWAEEARLKAEAEAEEARLARAKKQAEMNKTFLDAFGVSFSEVVTKLDQTQTELAETRTELHQTKTLIRAVIFNIDAKQDSSFSYPDQIFNLIAGSSPSFLVTFGGGLAALLPPEEVRVQLTASRVTSADSDESRIETVTGQLDSTGQCAIAVPLNFVGEYEISCAVGDQAIVTPFRLIVSAAAPDIAHSTLTASSTSVIAGEAPVILDIIGHDRHDNVCEPVAVMQAWSASCTPATGTVVAAADGSSRFFFSSTVSGEYTIRVGDLASDVIFEDLIVTVLAGAAARVEPEPPSETVAGNSASIRARLVDTFGNVAADCETYTLEAAVADVTLGLERDPSTPTFSAEWMSEIAGVYPIRIRATKATGELLAAETEVVIAAGAADNNHTLVEIRPSEPYHMAGQTVRLQVTGRDRFSNVTAVTGPVRLSCSWLSEARTLTPEEVAAGSAELALPTTVGEHTISSSIVASGELGALTLSVDVVAAAISASRSRVTVRGEAGSFSVDSPIVAGVTLVDEFGNAILQSQIGTRAEYAVQVSCEGGDIGTGLRFDDETAFVSVTASGMGELRLTLSLSDESHVAGSPVVAQVGPSADVEKWTTGELVFWLRSKGFERQAAIAEEKRFTGKKLKSLKEGDMLDICGFESDAEVAALEAVFPASARCEVIQNRYILGQLLGAGGQGQVHGALDKVTGRQIAIKLLPASTDDKEARRQERSVRVMQSISHPNILRLLSTGQVESGGQVYVTMEYLEGESLEGKRLEPAAVYQLATQMLSAVQCLHEAGIVHRDIKPANVMAVVLSESGSLFKLIDAGLVKEILSEAAAQITTAAAPITQLFCAPEYLTAPNAVYTFRHDLWALLATLYSVLTGRLPFDSLPSILNASVSASLTLAECGGIEALHTLITRGLSKDPGQRFGSAEEMMAVLRSAAGCSKTQIELDGAVALDIVHNQRAAIADLVSQGVDVRLLVEGLELFGPTERVGKARALIDDWAAEASSSVVNDGEGTMFWSGLHMADESEWLRTEAARFGVTVMARPRVGTMPACMLRGRGAAIRLVRQSWLARVAGLGLYGEVQADSEETQLVQGVVMSHLQNVYPKYSYRAVHLRRVNNTGCLVPHMRYLRHVQAVGIDSTCRLAYHCTPAVFLDVIARENVLPFGHPRNTKTSRSDDGYFGTNTRGCYFAGSFDYSLQYAGLGAPPPFGSVVDVLVMSVIPGRERVLPVGQSQMGVTPTPGYDAHTTASSRPDGQRTEWYLYGSEWDGAGTAIVEQWVPLYVMSVECVRNEVAQVVNLPSNQVV